ncbi:hypothetical protein [Bacillus sp. B-jedd]|uniref:hypothetical protein n=1 Tax=Bacillus sp. B-jedd TaxID=1476857 RepID=UPI0011DC86F9|nr:hypothetical protein [Bacillus sp. B-jedd]
MAANREIIEEKDERIAQLKRLLIELQGPRQQSAAAIAIDYNSRSFSPPKGKSKFSLKAAGLKIILPILVLIIVFGGIWWLSRPSLIAA